VLNAEARKGLAAGQRQAQRWLLCSGAALGVPASATPTRIFDPGRPGQGGHRARHLGEVLRPRPRVVNCQGPGASTQVGREGSPPAILASHGTSTRGRSKGLPCIDLIVEGAHGPSSDRLGCRCQVTADPDRGRPPHGRLTANQSGEVMGVRYYTGPMPRSCTAQQGPLTTLHVASHRLWFWSVPFQNT